MAVSAGFDGLVAMKGVVVHVVAGVNDAEVAVHGSVVAVIVVDVGFDLVVERNLVGLGHCVVAVIVVAAADILRVVGATG